MRDKLIELLDGKSIDTKADVEYVADYLLENGVIVPPCKVGDTVYQLDDIVWSWDCGDCEHFEAGWYDDPSRCGKTGDCRKCPECINITEETVTLKDILSYMCYESFGKTVLLTREEAERELQRRQGDSSNECKHG